MELERELLVGGALERHPVQWRDALTLDGLAVLGRGVAHVGGELPARMQRVRAMHEAIAGDLGDDRGSRDRGRRRVAVDDRALRIADVGNREAVDETEAVGPRDAHERVVQRVEVRPVQAARVDPGRAARDRGDLHRRAHDDRVERLARGGVVLLGVVEQREGADVADAQRFDVEEHGGGDERAGEAAAAGLVGTGDPADAEAPVELEETAAGATLLHATAGADGGGVGAVGRCVRYGGEGGLDGVVVQGGHHATPSGGGSAGAQPIGSEQADAADRPVRREGAADDPAARDGAPEAAVLRVATVVAHHEVVTRRDGDRRREVAPGAAAAPCAGAVDVGVLLALSVAVDVAAADVDAVAGEADHALDVVDARAAARGAVAGLPLFAVRVAADARLGADGRMEHDDLADVRVAEVVSDAVDEHALTDLQRRDHRLAGNLVRLDQEGLDGQRETEGDRDDDDELDDRAPRRLRGRARAHALSSLAAASPPSASASAAGCCSDVVSGASVSTISSTVAPSASTASGSAAASASSAAAGS